ncbi:MAG: DUF1501 domain-containing protein [Saprospiraceae bacterium]|nr:DUF1501 domain-containing protein [Saprospiraceae bacterium]
MKRRDFIKTVAPVAVVPFFSNKIFAAAYTPSVLNEAALLTIGAENDRILVIVQMTGGNDGLNTVFPMDQYSNLMTARSNILMPDTAPLILGTTQTGIHPAMTGLKSLFDEHKLAVVQSVGYTNQNYSHFRSTDIWTSGADSAEVLTTGWAGRYLEYAFPGFPDAYPNTLMPDPLAIQIGSNLSPALQGYEINTGQTVPTTFSGSITSLLGYTNSNTPSGNVGIELDFLRDQQAYTNQYASRIVTAWNSGTNLATYATTSTSSIAQQLKIVARLIKGGLKTKIYWVSLGSFDTHSNQVDTTDKTIGTHATMLASMSDAITAFQNDLRLMSLENRVVGFTFSEFGRRIKSNGSNGTDHGAAAPMFVFGSQVNWGVIGANPVIPANATTNDQVAMQFDFHKIYASILQNWFCVPQTDAETVLGDTATPLGAINGGCGVIPIELVRFSVEKANGTDAHIEWTTANESNTDTFDIERSTDAKSFKKVGTVKATGHSHEPVRYDYLDKDLPLSQAYVFYYRLKINDLDGTSTFSETRSVIFEKAGKSLLFDVSPNPAQSGKCQIILRGGIEESNTTEITITDLYGRQVARLSDNFRAESTVSLDLDDNISSGIYFVTVKNGLLSRVQKFVLE